ncbi:MAG: homoserine kinase [Oscillospiraceae bacterium]|nr:homoserine kinase [Oscillospiraceae bacterium]
MIKIRVPASSANMGAGFDTLGVALGLYNRIEIEEIPEGLEVINKNAHGFIPKDKNNLIYRSMLYLFEHVGYKAKGYRIGQNSSIPMTRGLGSSSACIVGGMLAANIISDRQLSYEEIIHLAAKMEGHPDNVGPAMYGGFCVSLTDEDKTIIKSTKLKNNIRFAALIPDYFMATRKSRGVLPPKVDFQDAVYNISHASMFQAAMLTGDMKALRIGAKDMLHQQYREVYVEGMEDIFEKTYSLGSHATYLSGSGPTIMSVLSGEYSAFRNSMQKYFIENSLKWRCMILPVDNVGAVVSVI